MNLRDILSIVVYNKVFLLSKEKLDLEMETSPAPTSSKATVDREDLLKRAQNAQFQGKRNFLMKDTASACAALEDACRLLVEIYGPLAKEHAEAHFFYGKALLEQARLDLAVFDAPGGAPADETKSGDDDDDEEDEDDDGEEEEEDDEKKADEGEMKTQDMTDDGNKDATEIEAAAKIEEGNDDKVTSDPTLTPTTEEDINDDAQPSTSKGVSASAAAAAETEEELNNLELAWEVFEIAKIDYTKHIEELEGILFRASNDELSAEDRAVKRKLLCDLKRRLAETHCLLGEVGTESEIYPQAIEDFKTALSMYSDLESPDSREIAQVHFHIGLAYGLEKNFKESVQSLNNSVEIIRQRIENLRKQVNESTDEDVKGPLEKEILELTELLPELQEKINDTLEQERDVKKVEEEEKMEQEIILRNSPVKNPNPPAANDISHLVKKRKKIELEPAPPASNITTSNTIITTSVSDGIVEPPSKKVCTDLSFDSTPTPTNGHSNADHVANQME